MFHVERSDGSTWNGAFSFTTNGGPGYLPSARMGRTITIASQKGGVGKTTTAVNLAASLCLSGKQVLLIDFDPQANATSGVGIHRIAPSRSTAGAQAHFLSSAIDGEAGLTPFISKSPIENLSVIPSTSELSRLEVIKEIQDTLFSKLRSQVKVVSKDFDYVLIDCPPSLGGLPSIALGLSDSVLIPIQCEYYAMEGLSQILPVIRDLQRATNPRLSIFGLLLTMYSDDLQLSHDVVEEVRGYFKDVVFRSVIPRDVVLAEAASHGLPAFLYDPLSRGAWSYIELAKEVLSHERSQTGQGS